MNINKNSYDEEQPEFMPKSIHQKETATATAFRELDSDGVIHIRRIRPNHPSVVRRQPKQPPVPANPATVANSLGIPWSVAKTSFDQPKSKKWRLALNTAMQAQGIAGFHCGDFVEIEAGLGERRYGLMGWASCNSMAYFRSQDLLDAGIGLYQAVNLVIVAIHPAP